MRGWLGAAGPSRYCGPAGGLEVSVTDDADA